jgi:hypothetical protein
MRFFNRFSVTLLAAVATAGLTGCFSTDVGPSAEDIQRADSSAAVGTGKLDGVFKDLTSPDYEYGNGNLTRLRSADADFQAALKLDPSNPEARFGASLTGVLLAQQSAKVKELFDEALNGTSPLNSGLTKQGAAARVAVLGRLAATDRPEVHELQDAVADTLLPALEDAIRNLQALYEDPAFSLTLTLDGEARELDHGEVTVLLAGFKTLHALATLPLAYDYDFDVNGSYDYLEVIEGIDDIENLSAAERTALNSLTNMLKPGKPFLAVRSGWKTRLAGVDDEIDGALKILQDGLPTLALETDDQADDLLRLCPSNATGVQYDCIDRAEFDEGLAAVDSLRKYMNEPYAAQVAGNTVKVNLAAYFNVQDYKKMLPWYGFYDAGTWGAEYPVFFFANSSGSNTGDLNTLIELSDRAYEEDWSNEALVAELRKVIRWQDPTFQGLLPGMTESKLWALITDIANEGEGDAFFLAKGKRPRIVARFLDPTFALSLIGR